MLLCRVNFLDDTHFMWELERNAMGQDLFNEVCEHLDLLERDYFGLAMWDSQNTRVWLDCAKEIRKQIKGPELEFFFNIKFYPPDPSVLAEDITRYLLCLQLRKDIVIGRLPCPSDMLAVLGSYTVQSTLGDYDPKVHTNNYVSKIVLAPNQNEELEKRVMEQHSTHRSMSPGQADMLFLEYAKTLPMYGVDLHPAKDVSGADVMLGVCSEGLMVYEDEVKINSFSWPKVLKMSHKRNTFLFKIRPSEDELDGDVSFTLPSYKACKQLWKCSVESHGFFRNRLQDTKAKKFLTLGSRFRYHGRTQSECLEASVNINRVPPQFSRIATKRKANEEFLEVLNQPVGAELDDWFLVHDSDKWDIAGTSDDVMLESKEVWESKQRADDWFVLLENSQISPSGLQKPPQTEEESKVEIVEENESQERFEDELVIKRSYKVHVEQEGPVELKVMEELARDIMEKEHPELMGPMTESLTEEILQVNGERIQKVVITKQWAQGVSTFVEPQEDAEIKTERVETMRRHVVVTEGGGMLRMDSEEPSERLEIMEQRLNEVEAIEQKILDVEELRVGLQELESLEQRLQQAERERLQQVETADWYILLDRSPLMLTAPLTADEELEQIDIPKPMERNDDWYILLEMPPRTISAPPTDMISSIPGEDQTEEESREAERKIQLLLPEMPGEEATVEIYEETREEVTQTRVKIEVEEEEEEEVEEEEEEKEEVEEEEEEEEQVKVDYRSPQPVFLEQPQRDLEDDWFILLDVSPKTSVPVAYPLLRRTTVELHEERREEVQREKQEQEEEVTVEVRKQQPVMLEQIVAQPQRDFEDDWFVIFDVSPKGSVPLAYPLLRSTTVEVYEERREEPESRAKVEYKQQDQVEVWMLEQRAEKPQRDVEDDWSNIFDVSHKDTVPLTYPPLQEATVELYEENREKVVQRRVKREEQEIEVMTMSTEQTMITEKTMRVIQTPQMFPVVPREIDDDWFQLFDQVPYEQKRFLPDARFEERKAMERRVKEEQQKKPQQVQVTVEDSVILEPRAAQATRDVEEDLSIILGVSPKESVPETVELYDRSREEMTVKTMRVIQTPQEFPVVPREIDDDWFQMFDPLPYEQRSFPSDVKSRDIWVREPTKDQRVQRLVERVIEEQVRGKSVMTEERRVIFEERRERVDIMPQVFPVGVREVDDDWSELLDPTSYEKRAVPSVSVGTEEQRMKAREDIRVRQQEKRVRDDVEIRMRQEMRKQELDVRRSQPAVIVQTVAQPQREVEDDWFLLFDVSPKQTVVADVIKVDKRAEEVRRREVERRIEEERRRREEERKKQIKVDDRQKRLVIPETRPVRLRREVEDDWFTLMGVSPKDSVVSPVAMPKQRTHILVDQPLTSTPTAQPVSVTKTTYQDRTKDTLDITQESEAEESVSIRKSQIWTKRIEGESIYVRHSILMLEDFDVTQEVILRHHESVRELKRIFMEGVPDFGPTEWDRRLSSYSPTPKAQLPHANGEILISMGLIDDGKTVL